MLAFSGGGTRAAALSYGVLEELRRTDVVVKGKHRRLLDEVDLITGVSGLARVAKIRAIMAAGKLASGVVHGSTLNQPGPSSGKNRHLEYGTGTPQAAVQRRQRQRASLGQLDVRGIVGSKAQPLG